MIGLQASINDQAPIYAALESDGVLSVMAYVAHNSVGDGDRPRSHLEFGGMDHEDQIRRWFHDALRPGDEVRIVATDVAQPDPWEGVLPTPPAPEACPAGLEVVLNGDVIARRTVDSPGVILALVTWSRGAATNPTPGEYIHLDIGTDLNMALSVGDEVVFRALAG